jgi:hypothetical protein
MRKLKIKDRQNKDIKKILRYQFAGDPVYEKW